MLLKHLINQRTEGGKHSGNVVKLAKVTDQ